MSFEQSTDDDDSQPDQQIVVQDPEDFAKTRMLRSIFDAKDDYIDARRDANRKHENGDISFSDKCRRIYRHMQDLAMSIEPLLKTYDDGRYIWTEKTYIADGWARKDDLVSFEKAAEWADENDDALAERIETQHQYSPSHREKKKVTRIESDAIFAASETGVEFDGIRSLVRSTPMLCYNAYSPGIGQSPPPERLSDEVFRDIQTFISDIGLGVDMQTEQQTKIDDGLLEEVNEWRQKNV